MIRSWELCPTHLWPISEFMSVAVVSRSPSILTVFYFRYSNFPRALSKAFLWHPRNWALGSPEFNMPRVTFNQWRPLKKAPGFPIFGWEILGYVLRTSSAGPQQEGAPPISYPHFCWGSPKSLSQDLLWEKQNYYSLWQGNESIGVLENCRKMRFGREGGEFRQGHFQTDGGSVEPTSQQLLHVART